MSLIIYHKDNLEVLKEIKSNSIDLIYIDPPFNTGTIQKRESIKTINDSNGDRKGFGEKKYKTIKLGSKQYSDIFDDYLMFLEPRLIESYRILKENGSLFFHIDYREVHYCKVFLDIIYGRNSFINEIIWAFDYGARTKTKWPNKHNIILWYAKNPNNYKFNINECDKIEYMSPKLVGEEKAKKGKTPTDTWWHTIVSTNGKEKTGYPTQKPRGIIDRIIKVHSDPNDTIIDFFAGSGTTGESAITFNRNCILVDNNIEAINVMKKRFENYNDVTFLD